MESVGKDSGVRREVLRYIHHRPRSQGRIRNLYRSIGIPESYLISPEGKLLLSYPGAFPEGAAVMRAAIEKALAN